jgi:DNA polymerase-3 subunit delta
LKANRIVRYLGSNSRSNPLVMTIGVLYNYFTKVIKYHSLADKSKNSAASELGVSPFFMSEYELAAKNYSVNKLVHIINYLREYDVKSKGVGADMEEEDLLKELVYKILHGLNN